MRPSTGAQAALSGWCQPKPQLPRCGSTPKTGHKPPLSLSPATVTSSGRSGLVTGKTPINRETDCFVDFGHERDWPVYVMPSKIVAEYLEQSHATWLAGDPGKA